MVNCSLDWNTNNKYEISASTSNENLTTPIIPYGSTCRLYKTPSLPKNRNKSGIPVPTLTRDLSQISALRGHFEHFIQIFGHCFVVQSRKLHTFYPIEMNDNTHK